MQYNGVMIFVFRATPHDKMEGQIEFVLHICCRHAASVLAFMYITHTHITSGHTQQYTCIHLSTQSALFCNQTSLVDDPITQRTHWCCGANRQPITVHARASPLNPAQILHWTGSLFLVYKKNHHWGTSDCSLPIKQI